MSNRQHHPVSTVFERLEDRRLLTISPIVIGGPGSELASSAVTDASGNIYVAGFFQGTVDFDPTPAVSNLSAAGVASTFVAKYSPLGALVWAKRIGGLTAESDLNDLINMSAQVVLDAGGNLCVAGAFSGTRDFDPGAASFNLTSAGKADIFLAKLSSTGGFKWAKSIGGTSYDSVFGLATDAQKNIIITGSFRSTADFDPSGTVSSRTSKGDSDIYVAKYTSAGVYTWAKRFGASGTDEGQGAVVDADGNIYTVGFFSGSPDFDPGTGIRKLVSAGGLDAYVLKLDAAGAYSLAKSVGGASADAAFDVAIDSARNIFIGGSFIGTADFDPGVNTKSVSSAGLADGFLLKLTSTGVFERVKKLGGVGADAVLDINCRGSYLYVTGMFSGTASLYGQQAISEGGEDAFIAKLASSNFALQWSGADGTTRDDWGLAVAVDGSGNVFAAGFRAATAVFDMNAEVDLEDDGDAMFYKFNSIGELQ